MYLNIKSRTSFVVTINVGFRLMLASITSKAFGLSGDCTNAANLLIPIKKRVLFFHIASVDKAGKTEAELDLLMGRKWTRLVPQLNLIA